MRSMPYGILLKMVWYGDNNGTEELLCELCAAVRAPTANQ